MTTGVETVLKRHIGNGATVDWDYTFSTTNASQIAVFVKIGTAAQALVDPADYTLTRGDTSGSVKYPKSGSPLTSSDVLTIIRVAPFENTYDFDSQSRVDPANLEKSEDYLLWLCAQLDERMSRAILVQETDDTDPQALVTSLLASEANSAASASAAAASEANAATSETNAAASAVAAQAAVGAVKVTVNDTTASVLNSALLAGTGLTSTVNNPAGDETLTLALANTAVSPATYTHANVTVDQQGRITGASNGGSATEEAAGVVEEATAAEVTAETAAGAEAQLFVTPAKMKHNQGVAKAWVAFNGTGTLAILDSYNVTSVTDLGTGSYQPNLAITTANSNYAVTAGCDGRPNVAGFTPSIESRTTTSFRIYTGRQTSSTDFNYNLIDIDYATAHVFGDI